MPSYDASSARCLVFTFKEGLLSKLAHDLEIRVGSFTVEVDEARSSVRARFEASSLRVVHALADGRPNPGALSPADTRKIEQSIEADVLHSGRHPEVSFQSTLVEANGDGFRIAGELSLHGRLRHIEVPVRREADLLMADVTLNQPDFGIKPFKAALGALRIRPDVRVRIEVCAEDA